MATVEDKMSTLAYAERSCAPARLLGALSTLAPAAHEALVRAVGNPITEIPARRDFAREGERPRAVSFVLRGWGCRYKQLPDGRRQVVSIMLPGDFSDADAGPLDRMDHAIGAITAMAVAEVSFERVQALREEHPSLSLAIAKYERTQIATQREWTTSLGQRSAIERIAHLLCELFLRLERVGATEGTGCVLPLTQTDIADACGVTPVHANRTIQEMRREGLIAMAGRQLVIPDLPSLMDRGLFDPAYLQLTTRPATFG